MRRAHQRDGPNTQYVLLLLVRCFIYISMCVCVCTHGSIGGGAAYITPKSSFFFAPFCFLSITLFPMLNNIYNFTPKTLGVAAALFFI